MRGVLLVGAGIVLGAGLTLAMEAAQAGKKNRLERKGFDKAVDALLDRYVEPVDRSEILSRGLRHMAAGLDDHSHFLSADERKRLQKQKASSGLVLHHRAAQGQNGAPGATVEIAAVVPGTPAAKLGLMAGDHLLEVRGRDTRFMLAAAEAEVLLLGKVGEKVPIVVQRRKASGNEPMELELVARTRSTKSLVTGRLVSVGGQKVAHLRVTAFRGGTGQRFRSEVARLREESGKDGLAGLVIDLRGNPGGEVSEALVIADLFLDHGIITRTRGRGGRIRTEETAHQKGTDTTTPLVVLQDRHSASASELLAAALQDHGRAVVVGEQSFGKGTVQEILGLPDGSLLKFTVARYFSPLDRVIDGVGVRPDRVVGPERAFSEALAALP